MFKPTQKKPQKLFPSGTLGQKAAVYFTLTLILTVIFCGALYIAGLSNATIQHRINNHVLHSVEQFKLEGIYPRIISAHGRVLSAGQFYRYHYFAGKHVNEHRERPFHNSDQSASVKNL